MRGISRKSLCLFVSVAVVSCFLFGSEAQGEDVSALVKQVNTDLRNAQNRMFSGKLEESLSLLESAQAGIEKIKAADPDNTQVKSLESKYARQKKDLDRRLPKESTPKTTTTSTSSGGGDALPSGVTYRLKQMLDKIDRAEKYVTEESVTSPESKVKSANYQMDSAQSLLDEIRERYGDQFSEDHPDFKAALDRMKQVNGEIAKFSSDVDAAAANAAAAKEADAKTAEGWLARFAPYTTSEMQEGYNPDKYFIAGGIANPTELVKRKGLHDELAAIFEEYKNSPEIANKPWELEQAEKDIAYDLESFMEEYDSIVAQMLKKADDSLQGEWKAVEKDDKWKKDEKVRPFVLSDDRIESVSDLIAVAEMVTKDATPPAAALRKKCNSLIKTNNERRKIRTERTFMTPDQFTGGELKDLHSKADSVVLGKFPKAKVLRTTVVSPDWKEEEVIEPTDSTNTALRHRITRSVSAQVAAKNGKVVDLYTVYIGKDKRSDGTWGQLKGHIMFTDRMLEKNVKKDAP